MYQSELSRSLRDFARLLGHTPVIDSDDCCCTCGYTGLVYGTHAINESWIFLLNGFGFNRVEQEVIRSLAYSFTGNIQELFDAAKEIVNGN